MPTTREFEVIERYFTRPVTDSAVSLGIGDDAAVVDVAGPLAVAVDTIVAGTHFPESTPPRVVGHRALAVNLSDLAAVGAKPRWATLAVTLPSADDEWIGDFATGFFELAERYGVSLIGGDTTRGPLSVTVQVFGEAAANPLRRSAGRVGDLVFVSGTLGDSAAALECMHLNADSRPGLADDLIERFSYPEPRVDLGRALVGLAHAAIDVSDGLVSDLEHVCAQSACGAVIELEALPLSDALRRTFPGERGLKLALYGGDDYELCFTAAPMEADRVQEAAGGAATPVTRIGFLTDDPGIKGRTGSACVALEATGFTHFDRIP